MPTKKPSKSDPTAAEADPMHDMARLQAEGLSALTGMNNAWFETLNDMGNEVMSFVADRIKQDVKTQQQMLQCRDATELQKIQAEFLQNAVDQYATETGKLVEMSQKMFQLPDDKPPRES